MRNDTNRWKGFLTGMIGAVAGLLAMRYYWQKMAPLVHWAYGMFQGGTYGASRYGSSWPDLTGGMSYATGLWLLGDEIAVPLLGLQKGPTAYPVVQHLNRWGAHLAYGSALAATTKTLQWPL